jgi:hypothetical protein
VPCSIPVSSPAERNLPPSRRPLPSIVFFPACPSPLATNSCCLLTPRHCCGCCCCCALASAWFTSELHKSSRARQQQPLCLLACRRLLDHFVGFSLAWLAVLFIPSQHRTRGGNWRRTKAAEVTSDFTPAILFFL